MQEESIYNLLVAEKIADPTKTQHISKHNPYIIPTGSTFINHTTSRPGVMVVKLISGCECIWRTS